MNREATATAAPLFAGTVRHHQRSPPTSGNRFFFTGLSITEISFQTTFSLFNFTEKSLVFTLYTKVLLFIKRLFASLATPWSTSTRSSVA
jgi:hypothetical protein